MTDWDPVQLEAARSSLLERLAPLREALTREPLEAKRLAMAEGPDDRFGRLVQRLPLTGFEAGWLLLAVGVRLVPEIADRVRSAAGQDVATFGLANQLIAEPHLSALHPSRPLLRSQLVRPTGAGPLGARGFEVSDRLLYHLLGMDALDPALEPVLETVDGPPLHLPTWVARAREVANDLLESWDTLYVDRVVMEGPLAAARGFAALVGRLLGLAVLRVDADVATWSANDREGFRRLWERELLLGPGALWVEHGRPSDLARLPGLVFVAANVPDVAELPSAIRVRVPEPPLAEVLDGWTEHLGLDDREYAELAEALFDVRLSLEQWRAAMVRTSAERSRNTVLDLASIVLQACTEQQEAALAERAQRIDARATWTDLVLPDAAITKLKAIVHQARHRYQVLREWGFDRISSRGLAVTALFHGPSGTGKTLAAEVLASELGRPLYRIDLSRIVSKYIGETEKNLRAILAAADGTGAILLFDEADALFGKRSEVKDSHDRYANLEVSFLLQEMEQYRGLALLTTNRKDDMDDAFRRRLRFILGFTNPDVEARQRMWARAFPPEVPTEGLDIAALARHPLTGGDIRNAALAAAYAAAEAPAVRREHVEKAVRAELVKSGRI